VSVIPGVNRDCWQYLIPENKWVVYSTMKLDHARMPGVLYQGKVYMLNDGNGNEVMDIESKTWSAFPAKPLDNGYGSCAVTWNQNIIIFGGIKLYTVVQVSPLLMNVR
jgi:hypothetical protein